MAFGASLLDNLGVHKSPKAAAFLRERGAWFRSRGKPSTGRLSAPSNLPPCSPDLKPIEMAFAKLKAHLRRIGARTIDALCRAIGEICGLFDPDQCWNYLREVGYASD